MAEFSATYSDDQRAAVGAAYLGGIRPAQAVADLAARGELTFGGKRLPKFTVSASYVRGVAQALRQRQLGLARGGFDFPAPRDAWEHIDQGAARVAQDELTALELQPRGKRDLERLRKLVQTVRAAQRLRDTGALGDGVRPSASGVPEEPPAVAVGGSLMAAHLASPADLSVVPAAEPVEPAPVEAPAPVESEAARVRREIAEEIRAMEEAG